MTKSNVKEIPVKKSRDFDFSVPVRVIRNDAMEDLVIKMSELAPRDLKDAYRAAKSLRNATQIIETLRETN